MRRNVYDTLQHFFHSSTVVIVVHITKINETHEELICVSHHINNDEFSYFHFIIFFFLFHWLTVCLFSFILFWNKKINFYREHIAAVMCVTSAMNNTLIVSGGDDSSIIISSFSSGKSVSNKKIHIFIF